MRPFVVWKFLAAFMLLGCQSGVRSAEQVPEPVGDAQPPQLHLDSDVVAEIRPATIDSPWREWIPTPKDCDRLAGAQVAAKAVEWEFVKPVWDVGEDYGGPMTLSEFRDGFVGTQEALLRSPAKEHAPDPHISTLWVEPGHDLVIYLIVQPSPNEDTRPYLAVTPLLNWKPVPTAEFVEFDATRTTELARFTAAGYFRPITGEAVILDVRIPAAELVAGSFNEFALALRARGDTRRLASKFSRFTVYAGGADLLRHDCVSVPPEQPLAETFPVDDYLAYVVGRHRGLVLPETPDWPRLLMPTPGVPGTELSFRWFSLLSQHARSSAIVPIMNGIPIEPPTFTIEGTAEVGEWIVGGTGEFTVTLPDDAEVADIYYAEFPDPFQPARRPDGEPQFWPEGDGPGEDGKRVDFGSPFGGSEVLRYELQAEPSP